MFHIFVLGFACGMISTHFLYMLYFHFFIFSRFEKFTEETKKYVEDILQKDVVTQYLPMLHILRPNMNKLAEGSSLQSPNRILQD